MPLGYTIQAEVVVALAFAYGSRTGSASGRQKIVGRITC